MNPNQPAEDGQYKVVALKYRPQSFGELVGQSHIATALSNAIEKNRVGHAYLFTGARGVGKTSSARIFAKCLNCEQGPTMTPCNECDVCEAVSSGDDVDVLEIDGASNRGIDEIRQLRSNAAIRPSRSRYKIYIIDEVHMLTMQAFNALLKTLEEPPSHVKFIFCTTDPQKIPITVLSRCQRFDFSPVQTVEIAQRLNEIAKAEGVTADEDALALLARRANGSMRDSQSLLEQLFSFCGDQISVNEVHQLLGTADMSRIAGIATAMTNQEPAETLNLIHQSMSDGVDAGQMADQLLGYFRDMMAVRVGCGEDALLACTAPDMEHLGLLADASGLETILMIVQCLDSALVRMQSSLHSRTVLESAAIRICNLEKLDAVSDLVSSLSKSGPKSAGASTVARKPQRVPMQQVKYSKAESETPSKKNDQPSSPASVAVDSADITSDERATAVDQNSTDTVTNNPPAEHVESANAKTTLVNATNIGMLWKQTLDEMGDMTADMASEYEQVELQQPDQLIVTLVDTVNKDLCSKPERKQRFEAALKRITGSKIRIDFMASKRAKQDHAPAPKLSRSQQIRKLQDDSFVKQTISLFDAEITGYQEPMRTKKK